MKADELTWQDMKLIVNIADNLMEEWEPHGIIMSEEDYYKEVLLAYRKTKEE